MKITNVSTSHYAAGLFLAAAFIAGCGGGSQSLGPASGSNQGATQQIHPLQSVSTRVAVHNKWIQTIHASGSAACWAISPTPLPSVAPSASSPPITLTYDTTCTFVSVLPIKYGPLTTPSDCTFTVAYNGTMFVYSVTQGTNTDCKAFPSPTSIVNEIFQYNQDGSLGHKHNKSTLRPTFSVQELHHEST